MKVRFQADADFSQRIISAVRRREPAIDFQSHRALEEIVRAWIETEAEEWVNQMRVI